MNEFDFRELGQDDFEADRRDEIRLEIECRDIFGEKNFVVTDGQATDGGAGGCSFGALSPAPETDGPGTWAGGFSSSPASFKAGPVLISRERGLEDTPAPPETAAADSPAPRDIFADKRKEEKP